jgi:hypothetical protein
MSAKDDLDSLDRDWESHLRWRNGRRSLGGNDAAGKYRAERGGYGNDLAIVLSELPRSVREALVKDIESVIGAALDERYRAARAALVDRALDEARETLSKLAGQPVAVEIPSTNTSQEEDSDCG